MNIQNLNPFKKAADQKRDNDGKFTAGSGGLTKLKKFNWGRNAPVILVIALVGGFLVFKSFAGTYSACKMSGDTFLYSEECVNDSNEASVIRLYYGIFNRAPDKSGLTYWVGKLTSSTRKMTLTEVAKSFMASSEFSRKYGTLTNQAFVQAMYPQIFGRVPDAEGLKFWTSRLDNKRTTRESMIVEFTQSSEMKNLYSLTVANTLGISPFSYAQQLVSVPEKSVECLTTLKQIGDKKACASKNAYNGPSTETTVKINVKDLNLPAGYYAVSSDIMSGSDRWMNSGLRNNIYSTNDTDLSSNVINLNTDTGTSVPLQRPENSLWLFNANGSGWINGEDKADYSYVDVASFKIWRVNSWNDGSRLSASDYSDTTKKVLVSQAVTGCNYSATIKQIKVGDKMVDCKRNLYQVVGSSSSSKPDFKQSIAKSYSGKVSFQVYTCNCVADVNSYNKPDVMSPTKLRVRLLNTKTGKLVSISRIYYLDYYNDGVSWVNTGKIISKKTPVDGEIEIPKNYYVPWIVAETQLDSPASLRLELDVVNHASFRVNHSFFGNFWASDYYKDKDNIIER